MTVGFIDDTVTEITFEVRWNVGDSPNRPMKRVFPTEAAARLYVSRSALRLIPGHFMTVKVTHSVEVLPPEV